MPDDERQHREVSHGLGDTESALIDAVKTLADVLMAMNPNAVMALATIASNINATQSFKRTNQMLLSFLWGASSVCG